MDPATAELEERIRVGRVRLGRTLNQLQHRVVHVRDTSKRVMSLATLMAFVIAGTGVLVLVVRRVAQSRRQRRWLR